MGFANNINRICAQKGTNLTSLVKQVKGSGSFTTNINNGSLPKEREMVEMARLLNCSVMDFFDDGDEGVSEVKEVSGGMLLDEDEREIIRMFRCLTLKEKHLFMAQAYTHEAETLRRKE